MAYLKGFSLVAAQSVAVASQSTAKAVQVLSDTGGLAMCQIRIPALAADTFTVKLQGRATSGMGWVDLKKFDHVTVASLAQVGGALTEGQFITEIMPEMRCDFSGTITGAHIIDVVLVALGSATRVNS